MAKKSHGMRFGIKFWKIPETPREIPEKRLEVSVAISGEILEEFQRELLKEPQEKSQIELPEKELLKEHWRLLMVSCDSQNDMT